MLGVFIFVILNEAIIEYSIGNVLILRPYLSLLSLATAIMLAFLFQISVFSLVLDRDVVNPFFEFLFSGLIIARLSNFLNDLAQKLLGSK